MIKTYTNIDPNKPFICKKSRYIEKCTRQSMRVKSIDESSNEIRLVSPIDECIYKLSEFWIHFELDEYHEYYRKNKSKKAVKS